MKFYRVEFPAKFITTPAERAGFPIDQDEAAKGITELLRQHIVSTIELIDDNIDPNEIVVDKNRDKDQDDDYVAGLRQTY